jgi:hypothetical protein
VLEEAAVELSMGISGDTESAIEMRSDNVRVGSTIFSAINYAPNLGSYVFRGVVARATPKNQTERAEYIRQVTRRELRVGLEKEFASIRVRTAKL